jgi:hypothetical protein
MQFPNHEFAVRTYAGEQKALNQPGGALLKRSQRRIEHPDLPCEPWRPLDGIDVLNFTATVSAKAASCETSLDRFISASICLSASVIPVGFASSLSSAFHKGLHSETHFALRRNDRWSLNFPCIPKSRTRAVQPGWPVCRFASEIKTKSDPSGEVYAGILALAF